jgi:hypothetical protein
MVLIFTCTLFALLLPDIQNMLLSIRGEINLILYTGKYSIYLAKGQFMGTQFWLPSDSCGIFCSLRGTLHGT